MKAGFEGPPDEDSEGQVRINYRVALLNIRSAYGLSFLIWLDNVLDLILTFLSLLSIFIINKDDNIRK